MANQQKDQSKTSSTGPVPESFPGNANTGTSNKSGITNDSPRNAAPNPPAAGAASADAANKLKDSATDLYTQAKESASDSYDAVATKAKTAVTEQKNQFSAGLKTVANSIRQMSGQLKNTPDSNRLTDLTSEFTGKAAGTIDNVASYFDRKDPREYGSRRAGFRTPKPGDIFRDGICSGYAGSEIP